MEPVRRRVVRVGGQVAVAGLRGGGEEGEAWHQAGMREHKPQVFADFEAAADWLVAEGRTSRERLAIRGGSNGGLLVAACTTRRPDLCAAVVCDVPLTDMVRFPRFLIARLWIPEYGDPDIPEELAWLHAYSPYHQVADGTCYPPVLITTGEEDSRVDPCHARKLAARLQAATACGGSGRSSCGSSRRPATARASRPASRSRSGPTSSPSSPATSPADLTSHPVLRVRPKRARCRGRGAARTARSAVRGRGRMPSAAAVTGTGASAKPATMASSSASVRVGSWWKSRTDRAPASSARRTG